MTHMPPQFFPGLRLESKNVGFIRPIRTPASMDRFVSIQHLNQNLFIINRRTGAVSPLIGEWAIILLQTSVPKLFPGKIKRGNFSIAIKKHDYLSVRYR